VLTTAVGLLVAACGGTEDTADVAVVTPASTTTDTIAPPTASQSAGAMGTTNTPPTTTPPSTSPTTTSPTSPASTLDQPAVVTEPADRITEAAVVAWIGGSDVVLDDRDLPAAVDSRIDAIGDRPLLLVADTMIAPTVADVRDRVVAAAARGVEGLIVALNPSWVQWDGASCEGMTPKEVRYACLMTPVSAEVMATNAAALAELVDAVVATGLPAYLYVIPHSADSLSNPLIRDLIADAETAMATFDPGVDHVELVTPIFNRGLAGMGEGDGFINIVHPSVVGVERLADWLAAELLRFWTEAGL
jgi:hypothetical protein